MDSSITKESLLDQRLQLTEAISASPYDFLSYIKRAVLHLKLGYPDLAAGDAYNALNLTDEARNDGFEYHDEASSILETYVGTQQVTDLLKDGQLEGSFTISGDKDADMTTIGSAAAVRCYQLLAESLWLIGCLQKAMFFCSNGLKETPENTILVDLKSKIQKTADKCLKREGADIKDFPEWGLARREVYPWNSYEPERSSSEGLARLNEALAVMAPKCIVKTTELPVLEEGKAKLDEDGNPVTCVQLGVFAKEDISAGEPVLREYSLLTANNRLKETVCDACGSELPELGADSPAVECGECYDTVFCDQFCHDEAQEKYHPAVCDMGMDAIARDGDASVADEDLHLLLLSRVLAMAHHQEVHPLDVLEVKYIWGDFVSGETNSTKDIAAVVEETGRPPMSWTLPFNFDYNIDTPLHILEKMDVNIYETQAEHETWVFNTIYAKTRGTASARKNPRDGRPDVAAVHPFWCLANHDCDPNVTWEWGGRMVLWAREKRVVGDRPGGIKAGEEILNHYCDVTLPVQERREWACGSLGGWCMCARCKREAGETTETA